MPSIANFCANIGCVCANPGPQGPPGPQGATGAPGPAGEAPTIQQQRVAFVDHHDTDSYVSVSKPENMEVQAVSIFGPGREDLRLVATDQTSDFGKITLQYDYPKPGFDSPLHDTLTLEVVLFMTSIIR